MLEKDAPGASLNLLLSPNFIFDIPVPSLGGPSVDPSLGGRKALSLASYWESVGLKAPKRSVRLNCIVRLRLTLP